MFGAGEHLGPGPRLGAFAAVVLLAALALAQSEVRPPEAIVEYLQRHELRELQAVYLRDRLDRGGVSGDERTALAERLGRLYVELLEAARTPGERRELEAHSEALLREVPEADSFDLRISLARPRYLLAEEVAERHRLRMAGPQERDEAEQILRSVGTLYQRIGRQANQRVTVLERRQDVGRVDDPEALRAELADARRVRSLAFYYAGWSSYYLGLLTGGRDHPVDALREFGWILGSGGEREASLDRVTESLLRFEHVARAALGSAMAESMRGRSDTALRWLELLDRAEDLPQNVRRQLFARRIVILADAGRWADLEFQLGRRRVSLGEGERAPLPAGEARLLAVYVLEALNRADLPVRTRPLLEQLAKEAMGDLVAMGEVQHVLDLVKRYGSAHIGDEGFIVHYVRGLRAYEMAREAHGRSGVAEADGESAAQGPTRIDSIVTLYRSVTEAMGIASDADDAGAFPEQLGNARLLGGLALYYAGDLVEAARALERAHAQAATSAQAEEALWLAIMALDRAVEGVEGVADPRPSLEPQRERLAVMYLQTYPRGERAARLLLRRLAEGMTEEQAVEVLLGVEPGTPLYEAARRHAAGLLYRIFRRAISRGGDARDFAAMRFVEVAEPVMEADRRAAMQGVDEEAKEAGRRTVTYLRQILHAVLSASAPDVERAESALGVLDSLAVRAGVDTTGFADELAYRRLQVALLRGDEIEAQRLATALRDLGDGPFADAADRLLYDRSVRAWRGGDASAAGRVVRFGARVMRQFEPEQTTRADVANLIHTVAEAAEAEWLRSGDAAMRDAALAADRRLRDSGRPTAASLRRLARLAEQAGEAAEALEAWRSLLAGLADQSPAWFEARYHSIRVLAELDIQRAAEAMNQHRVLNPEYGPDPWGGKLRELESRIARRLRDAGSPDGGGGGSQR